MLLDVRLAHAQWTYMIGHSQAALALAQPGLLDGLKSAAADAGLPPQQVHLLGDMFLGRRRTWSYAARSATTFGAP